jgi:PAS domain S-box-containing protein
MLPCGATQTAEWSTSILWVKDITERRFALDSLSESEQRLREVLEDSLDAIYRRNLVTDTYDYISPAVEQVMGIPADEFATMSIDRFMERVHPDDREALQRQIEALPQVGRAMFTYRFRGNDGRYRWMADQAVLRLDDKGMPHYRSGVVRDVTDYRHAEAELLKRQRTMASAGRMARLGAWDVDVVDRTDLNSNKLTWSDEVYRIFGYEPGSVEVSNEMFFAHVHPDDRERIVAAVSEAIAERKPYEIHHRIIRRDGTERIVQEYAEFDFDDNGHLLRIVGAMQDITSQKETELALRRAEEQRQAALEAAGMGTWELELASGLVQWDQKCAGLFGMGDVASVSVDAVFERIHSEDRTRVERAVAETIRGERGGHYDVEYRMAVPGGDPRWVRAVGQVVLDGGRPSRFLGVVMDITERKRTEDHLRRHRELLQGIIDNIPVMLTIFDPALKSFRFNTAARTILGWTEKDAMDGSFMEKVYPDPGYRAKVEQFMRSLEGGWRDFTVTARNGTRIDSSWANIRLSDDTLIGIGIDIRERKAAEASLRRVVEELERSNKDLEQFAYVASHDLQEPLRVVGSFVDLLRRRTEGRLGQEPSEYMGFIVDGVSRMQELIKGLLAYSRVGRPFKDTCSDADTVLDGVLQAMRVRIEETGAEIVRSRLPEVCIDPVQLGQLFQNLVGNALKFKRRDIPLQVRISCRTLQETDPRREGQKAYQFSIADNGIGIQPEFHERIFLIFQRLHTRQEYAGTGIGLAICKKIVERHGGRIWVESQPGQGSTFHFMLWSGPAHTGDVGEEASP